MKINNLRLIILSFFCHVDVVSPVKHSLMFFFTGTSGIQNLPDSVGVLKADETELVYCDSNIKAIESSQDWEGFVETYPTHTQLYMHECVDSYNIFRVTVKDLIQQTGGVHTFQRRYGCEWDHQSEEVSGFDQYGFDGENLMEFDHKTEAWIAATPVPQGTKNKLENENRIPGIKHYLRQQCVDMLKKYLKDRRSSLQRTELPSVSLLQKSPSSPVSCHATGFYPDRAVMFWRKDREELHEDVDQGEILPNHDGTFQMSVDLKPSSPEDWSRYDCVFQLHGLKDDIVIKLDEAVIRSNSNPPSQFPAAAVIGVVVGLLLLILCISGLFMWRRNNHGFKPANTSDSSPSSVPDQLNMTSTQQ